MGDFSARLNRYVLSEGVLSATSATSESESDSGFESAGATRPMRVVRTISPLVHLPTTPQRETPTDGNSSQPQQTPNTLSEREILLREHAERVLRRRQRRLHKEVVRLTGSGRSAASLSRRLTLYNIEQQPSPSAGTGNASSFAADEATDPQQVVLAVPFQSVFAKALKDPEFRAFWEQVDYAAYVESQHQQAARDSHGHGHSARRRSQASSGESTAEVDVRNPASCMRRVPRTLRAFLRSFGRGSMFLENLEDQFRVHFGNSLNPFEPLVLCADNSWQRCFVHAAAAYYGLASHSTDVDTRRLTFVQWKSKKAFAMPAVRLSVHLSEILPVAEHNQPSAAAIAASAEGKKQQRKRRSHASKKDSTAHHGDGAAAVAPRASNRLVLVSQ